MSSSFWILIWILLSVMILGIFAWSLEILFKQKRSWKAFAKKQGLDFIPGPFLQSPGVRGDLSGYEFVMYSEQQPTNDVRGHRFRTVIQLTLPSGMPTAGLVASPGLRDFADQLDLPETVKPDYAGWKKDALIRARDAGALKRYLSDDRLNALSKLIAMRNAELTFIFDQNETYLRIETPDPLHEPDKIRRMAKHLVTQARRLDITRDKSARAEEQDGAGSETGTKQETGENEPASADDAPAAEKSTGTGQTPEQAAERDEDTAPESKK